MPKLVDRIRTAISVEFDDFFDTDTVVYYANRAQDEIVDDLLSREMAFGRSLRGLDQLRRTQFPNLKSVRKETFWQASSDAPDDMRQYNYLSFGTTPLREIPPSSLQFLETGGYEPNEFECYFYVSEGFEYFLHKEPSDEQIKIYYVTDPQPIEKEDAQIPDLPRQLQKPLVYGAATMMGLQEKNQLSETLQTIYQNALQNALY